MADFLTFLSTLPTWLFLVVALWEMPWKGVALWRAATRKQLVWFIVLFVVNTLAILEILYIFIFSKKRQKREKIEKK